MIIDIIGFVISGSLIIISLVMLIKFIQLIKENNNENK